MAQRCRLPERHTSAVKRRGAISDLVPTRAGKHPIVATVILALSVALFSGCALGGNGAIAAQKSQLDEYIAQADGAAAEIFAQIPEEKLLPGQDTGNFGGPRLVSEHYAEWPKYYYWAQIIELKADGLRTPTQVADDLGPWLKEEGWKRNSDSEFPPSDESFERHYYRDGYHLIVRAYTIPPPHA